MRHFIRSYVQIYDVGSVYAYPRRSIPDRIFVVPGSRLVVRGSKRWISRAGCLLVSGDVVNVLVEAPPGTRGYRLSHTSNAGDSCVEIRREKFTLS